MNGLIGLRAILLVLLPWVFFFGSQRNSRGATAPTVADIISGMRQSEALLLNSEGFLVRCQRVKSEVITPSKYGGGFLNVEFVVAHKKGNWLVHKQFLGNDAFLPRADLRIPHKPLTIAAKDGLLFQWQQSSPTALVDKFNNGGNLFQCLDYFTHLGVDIARSMAESNDADYERIRNIPALGDYLDQPFLPEYLERNGSKYSVHSSMELVDGVPCWIVEYPEMDKLWVDADRSYAVLRRIYHWGPGKPRKFEIHNKDFKKVIPGLWLPFLQVVDKYASIVAEERSLWGKVTSRMYYHVEEAAVGSISDDVFKIPIPEGLLVYDDARGIQYRVPSKDVDPFRGPDANQWRMLQNRLKGGRGWRGVIIIVNVILICGLIVIVLWRKKRELTDKFLLMLLSAGVCCGGLASSSALTAHANDVTLEAKKSTSEPFILFPGEHTSQVKAQQNEVFCWKPKWRSKGDCGPCALSILMSLTGHSATFTQVKDLIAVDPEKGCSLKSLHQAAIELGFPVEVRFVNPKLMTEIPRPFIMHGKSSIQSDTGHFLIVVDYNRANGTFGVIDPVLEHFSTVGVDNLVSDFTGYTIIPARKWGAIGVRVIGWLLFLSVSIACLATAWTMHLATRGNSCGD